jgi:hypothetical protein
LKIVNLMVLINSAQMFFRSFGLRNATEALGEFAIGLAGTPERRTEMTASLQRMIRDPWTGEVHMPHEPLSIIRTIENLGPDNRVGEAHHAISSALLDTLKNERQEMRKLIATLVNRRGSKAANHRRPHCVDANPACIGEDARLTRRAP